MLRQRTAAPPPRPPKRRGVLLSDGHYTWVPWATFRAWWATEWKPGQHVYISTLTGGGKTTLGVRLCEHRPYVAALDAKGLDSSLSASGWPRVEKWLPFSVRQEIRDRQPVRIIVGGRNSNDKDFGRLRALLHRSIKGIWAMGNWTVFADEGQILADSRFIGAGADIDKMLIAARDRKNSIVYSSQRPSIGQRAPAALTAQQMADWIFVSRTRDRRVIVRLGELCGRPTAEITKVIEGLAKYEWACFGLDPFEPVRIFTPPPLPARPAAPRSRLSVTLYGSNSPGAP